MDQNGSSHWEQGSKEILFFQSKPVKRIVQHVVWYMQKQQPGPCKLCLHTQNSAAFTTATQVNWFTCIVLAGQKLYIT